MNAKVRHELLQLTLDVPEDDTLLAWAAAPFKALAGEVVFYHATQLVAHETIAFAAGQCVAYHETFASGAGRDGVYVCQLSIAAPSFELRSGGPDGCSGGRSKCVNYYRGSFALGKSSSLANFTQTKEDFVRLFAQSPDISRTLVPGSLEVFPVKDYRAMHIATQRFCHRENSRNDCGNSKFAMV